MNKKYMPIDKEIRMSEVFCSHEGAERFLDKVKELKGKFNEREVAAYLGLNTVDLRRLISIANITVREYLLERARKMKEAGKSTREIAIKLGRNESTIRGLLEVQYE